MSAIVILCILGALKVILEVASVVAMKQQEEREEAQRTPVHVESAGALPGEALAPLPTSQPMVGLVVDARKPTNTAISARTLDPKDLFDPAMFLIVEQRRKTPQNDLFDPLAATSTLNQLTIPDESDRWMTSDAEGVHLGLEDEIYLQTSTDDVFDYMSSDE